MKLKTKFTLIVSVFVVTLLSLVALFTFSHFKKAIKETIAQQQFRMVSILADEIDSKLLTAQQHIVSVAQNAPPDIMQNTGKAQTFLDSMPSLHIMFDNNVLLLTPSGKIFVDSPYAPNRRGLDLSFRDYISETLKTKKPYISDPFISSKSHKHPVIMFTAPLFDGKGKITGILAGSIDLLRDNFLERVGTVKIGESGNLYLYEEDGTMIVHPDKTRILVRQHRGLNRLYDMARDGFEGTGETTTSYGLQVVSSFKRLKTKNWILAANTPQAEAYRPIRQVEQTLLMAAVIGLIAIFLIISYIVKYLVEPLELFTRHIEELPQKKGDDRFLNVKTKDEIGTLSLAFNKMETERKQSGEALRLHADRVQALLNLNQMTDATLQQITDYTLEETVRLTQSRIAYIAFLNDDETVLTMHSWSKQAMQECAISDKPIHYIVKETGLWGEAVRQRRAVITNDYAAPNPWKKGYPAGHVTVQRHMNVPVFAGRHIVLVAGVGNKDVDYNETDVQQLTLMLEGMWRLIERKRGEETIARERILSDHIINSLPQIFYMFDDQGSLVRWNKKYEEVTGYSPEELLGMHPVDFFPEASKEYISSRVQSVFTSGEAFAEAPFLTKSGKQIPYLFTGRLTELDGRQYLLGVGVDMTDRKRAEVEKDALQAQLLQAQKMESVGRLAGGVAHDFNNMLGVIIGHVELAMMQVNPASPIKANLKEIQEAANRSANLTRQLLAFARRQTVAPKVVDLNNCVTGMLKMLQRLMGEDISLSWNPAADLWQVKIDLAQIDQLLANLCVNARDAIVGVGKVTIETQNTTFDESYCAVHKGFVCGEYVMLAVSDNGSGMNKDVIDHLFEPFFTTKRVGKGTGLGLATVYGIVKQNDGFINVYSEPGKGATFKIYLPRFVGEAVEPTSECPSGPPKGSGETVLLVEDEAAILNVGKAMLEELGYTVLTAGTPGEALSQAKAHSADIRLLIIDVIMPEMNGRELSKLISQIKPGLKSLFISGYTADVIAHHGVLDEGLSFLQKPFSMNDLAYKVRETLQRR